MKLRNVFSIAKKALKDPRSFKAFAFALKAFGLVLFFIITPLIHAASLPHDAKETTYVWKKGDTLSSALFSLGLGHGGNTARLYGSRGWVARNSEYFKGIKWEATEPGTKVVLIIPKSDVPVSHSQIPEPLAAPEPAPTPETVTIPEPVASSTPEAAPTEDLKLEEEPVAKVTIPGKKVTRAPVRADTKMRKTAGLIVFLAMFIVLIVFFYQQRIKSLRDKKVSVVANSFLSWLTFSGSHHHEHIAMAETLFAGKVSPRSLHSYEVMGYFNKDIEHLKGIEERMKMDGYAPPFESPLPFTQIEYLTKFLTMSPEVFCNLIGLASSPFLQIRALKILVAFRNENPTYPIAPDIVQMLYHNCARYNSLKGNPAVKAQIFRTLAALDPPKPVPATG